jgi:hypothetical protein
MESDSDLTYHYYFILEVRTVVNSVNFHLSILLLPGIAELARYELLVGSVKGALSLGSSSICYSLSKHFLNYYYLVIQKLLLALKIWSSQVS